MRALVLSGGGAKGAYQVGALYHILGHETYDLLCGISVGALNSGFLSQYDNLKLGAWHLNKMWRETNNRKVRKFWPGWFAAALWKPSLYNSTPLQKMVKKHISPDKMVRELIVGAVSIPEGEYQIWTDQDKDIIEGILASSAFPAMLNPIKTRGRLWLDGGLHRVTPIKDAIDAGATEIDVIMTSPHEDNREISPCASAIDLAIASMDILLDEAIDKDLKLAHLYNKLAQLKATTKRHVPIRVLRPSKQLGAPLQFKPDKIKQEIQLGFEDAKKEGFRPLRLMI